MCITTSYDLQTSIYSNCSLSEKNVNKSAIILLFGVKTEHKNQILSIMKKLNFSQMELIEAGFSINFFGLVVIDGILDGTPNNTTVTWFWQ